ncbi:MAG: alanine and proline-rich secreted protein Apa [Caulobacteraceae bacterium]|nr:alanine and proline-rich secreted protein Apa [Caulobacteraceae bacterium]
MQLRRFLLFSLLAVVLGASVAGGGYWAYWNFYARWRPVTIVKNQAEIQKLLDAAGAVSPGRTGPWLYMITYRACAPCARYQREEFPKLAEANVDTRVIAYARPDKEGLAQSTAPERATVAELWINRSWPLYLQWMAVPRQQWSAPGVRPADGDIARTAVVDASRQFTDKLEPYLKANGLGSEYPLLIWRDRDGYLKACACADRRSYAFIRHDLGVADETPSIIAVPRPETQPELAPPVEAPADSAPVAPRPRPAARDPLATPARPIPYQPGGSTPSTSAPAQSPPPANRGNQPPPKNDSDNIFY